MFLSAPVLPPQVLDHEVHQHLHFQFDRKDRCFLYRRDGAHTIMLSVERPKLQHVHLPVERLHISHPVSFAADLVITRAEHIGPTSRGRRVDIRDHDHRRAWLRRALDGAALVPFARFEDRSFTLANGVRRIIAQTTGCIQITDPGAFAAVLQTGIGRGRAFGCGLLWIPEAMQ